jgi:hypothetical protein
MIEENSYIYQIIYIKRTIAEFKNYYINQIIS